VTLYFAPYIEMVDHGYKDVELLAAAVRATMVRGYAAHLLPLFTLLERRR
jgi:hypothetical protein